MSALKKILILFLIGAGILYLLDKEFSVFPIRSTMVEKPVSKQTEIVSKPEVKIDPISELEGELYAWMGKDIEKLTKELGEPVRKDLSSYGYTWWVYTNKSDQYIQFGIRDEKIVTLFATGNNLSSEPVYIGQAYEEIDETFGFEKEVSFSTYRFQLSDEEIKVKPLIKLDEETFIQFYFDTFTNKLSSIRILSKDVLLTQRPYEIFYRGELPATPLISDKEWESIEVGMEQQIFDITNIIRKRFGESQLEWEDSAAEVAFGHSKDMSENNYFSHYTLDGRGLKERLSSKSIIYASAGENIAAQYTDGPAVVEGWLNSKGHREALLKSDYTHLGIGVYRYYYTQNFLKKLSQ